MAAPGERPGNIEVADAVEPQLEQVGRCVAVPEGAERHQRLGGDGVDDLNHKKKASSAAD